MKNLFCIVLLNIILGSWLNVGAQSNTSSKNKSKPVNYSKYIGKTVEYFFSNFPLPIKDTIPIRNYTGIHRFILDIGNNQYLYINPELIKDSSFLKRKREDDFELRAFYPYKITSIIHKKNGKLQKVYGKYNGRL